MCKKFRGNSEILHYLTCSTTVCACCKCKQSILVERQIQRRLTLGKQAIVLALDACIFILYSY